MMNFFLKGGELTYEDEKEDFSQFARKNFLYDAYHPHVIRDDLARLCRRLVLDGANSPPTRPKQPSQPKKTPMQPKQPSQTKKTPMQPKNQSPPKKTSSQPKNQSQPKKAKQLKRNVTFSGFKGDSESDNDSGSGDPFYDEANNSKKKSVASLHNKARKQALVAKAEEKRQRTQFQGMLSKPTDKKPTKKPWYNYDRIMGQAAASVNQAKDPTF